MPIHCTDNWKRRKVLEQSPVYRSLAGRGWIKYCIVSNITNCTPSCRQLCQWHCFYFFLSLFIIFFYHIFFVGWSIEMHWFCFFAKSMSYRGSFCQVKWRRKVQSWIAVGRVWLGVGQRPGRLWVCRSTDNIVRKFGWKMCQIVGFWPHYWGGIEEEFVCRCQPFLYFFKLSCMQFLPSALLVTISTPITKSCTHNISFHLPTPKQMQD